MTFQPCKSSTPKPRGELGPSHRRADGPQLGSTLLGGRLRLGTKAKLLLLPEGLRSARGKRATLSARQNDHRVLSRPEPAVTRAHPRLRARIVRGLPCPLVLKLPGSAEGQVHTELKAPPLQRQTASEQASRTFYRPQMHVWGREDRGP